MHFRGTLLFKEIYRTITQDKLPEGPSSVLIKKPKIKVFEVFEKRCIALSVSALGQLPLLCWTYLFIFGLWSRFGEIRVSLAWSSLIYTGSSNCHNHLHWSTILKHSAGLGIGQTQEPSIFAMANYQRNPLDGAGNGFSTSPN